MFSQVRTWLRDRRDTRETFKEGLELTVYVVLAIYDPDYEYTDYELRGVIAGVEGVYATRAEAESVKPGEQGFLTEISEWSLDLP